MGRVALPVLVAVVAVVSIYRIGRGDPNSHAHNARRALIVRRHRELLERELRDLEREIEERAATQPGDPTT